MSTQQRLVLLVAILASFVAFLDGSVINVALPAISRDLGGGLPVQQWLVDAYLITLSALMLVAGSFSDAFGRLLILRIGLIGFAVASVLCAVAPGPAFLIVARALQGVAGALLVPSSLAMIISAFETEDQGKAIGSWTAWTGTAMLVGPLLGGVFVDALSWRPVFAVNLAPIAVTLWLIARLDREPRREDRSRIDYLGAVLGALGLGGPVFALIEQERFGWGSPVVLAPLIAGLLAFAAFLWWERRTPEPMMPLEVFRAGNFSVGNVATVFVYGALAFGSFAISVFVQQFGGFTATAAGLATLPPTIIMLLLASRFGGLSGRFGPRWFMAAGPVVCGIGYLTMLAVDARVDYWTDLLPGIVIFGLGLALTVAPLTSAILGSVPARQAGIGSAINNAVSRVAGLLTIAFTGIIVGAGLDLAGFHRAVLVTGLMLIAGGLVSAIGIRNPPRTPA